MKLKIQGGFKVERPNAWKDYSDKDMEQLNKLGASYTEFISNNKTERECVASAVEIAETNGYKNLNDLIANNTALKTGDRVYAVNHDKTLLMVELGSEPLQNGLNILGAHVDSPRLDIKQNPLEEKSEIAFLDTHYYGGIKTYQWVTIPLAIHGVFCKKDGTTVKVSIGEKATDPVFVISDILPHLGRKQAELKLNDGVAGEDLDLIIGNRPAKLEDDEEAKDLVAKTIIDILKAEYGVEEEDFLSAELEVVPAGAARDCGLDRSMILGYGHDDRCCSYPSLLAQIEVVDPKRTAVCLLVDKEEIGSVGATGMTSKFFENAMAEIFVLAGETHPLALRRCLTNSFMLSSDVSACFDPAFANVFEKKNACFMGHGLAFNKYTGGRGKGGSNDADAEYMAKIRSIMDERNVKFQTCELGKVDAGGGGTIAYILAKYDMHVIDSGIGVLSMHAPWELISKADLFEAYKGYKAFLDLA